jgi:mono/diheme cytochrome c family protein
MASPQTTRLVLVTGAIALAALAGCRGDRSATRPRQFFPDMDDSPKFKPQTQTPFFADSRAMRRPVEHTVPFGESTITGTNTESEFLKKVAEERASHLKDDTGFYFGTGDGGKYLPTIPPRVVVDKKLLARGEERYNIYCSACHGYDGYGKGMVGAQWQGVVANFHDAKFTDPAQVQSNDGYIFHVIRNGLPADDPKLPMRMPSYGYSVNESDAWAIVAYVRALQAQQDGTVADLAPAARESLDKTRATEIEKVKQRRAAEAAAAAKAAGSAKPVDANPAAPKAPEVKP